MVSNKNTLCVHVQHVPWGVSTGLGGELHAGPKSSTAILCKGKRAEPVLLLRGISHAKDKWISLSSQLRGSHQVSFSSLTILSYLLEAFFSLPVLLKLGSGLKPSFCREQLSPPCLLQPLLLLILIVVLEDPSVYTEHVVVEKGKKKQRTGTSILAVSAASQLELHINICQLSVC